MCDMQKARGQSFSEYIATIRNVSYRVYVMPGSEPNTWTVDDPAARRDRVMNGLKTGGLDVVGNCDLISEGFDAPGCEAVIIGAPTSSVTRYLQQAGRGDAAG